MRAERVSEARPLYIGVTRAVPGYAAAWFSAALCSARAGDAARAEQAFRACLRLQPLSADGHSALGLLLLSAQRIPEARAELQEALRLDPTAAEAKEALQALEAKPK